ncbi:MAG: glycosyltransferase [Deltaproteobacteria bacterium]
MHSRTADYDHFVELRPSQAPPGISVLMPVYNQRAYVGAAITSALAQQGIVAEIIFSDDGSSDGTFEEALQIIDGWLKKNECPHRIIVRRGKQRLWRDHLPLLIDRAGCDLVCQAHGDDLSAATRCRKLVQVFTADPLISLAASEAALFTGFRNPEGEGRIKEGAKSLYPFSDSDLIDGHRFLIGALLAWRKSAVKGFPRLDRRFSATSHDRILTFRASLAGKVVLLQEPLVHRRAHPHQASRLLYHEPNRNSDFGRSLLWMNAFWAMKRDLSRAMDLDLIGQDKKNRLEGEINRRMDAFQQRLLESFRRYTYAGQYIAWVDDETLRKMKVTFMSTVKMYIEPVIMRFWRITGPLLNFMRRMSDRLRGYR